MKIHSRKRQKEKGRLPLLAFSLEIRIVEPRLTTANPLFLLAYGNQFRDSLPFKPN